MCGEKKRHVIQLNRTWGSSPRVRGKERLPHMAAQSGGINPAYAGKSDIPHPAAHYGRQVVRGLCRHFKRA